MSKRKDWKDPKDYLIEAYTNKLINDYKQDDEKEQERQRQRALSSPSTSVSTNSSTTSQKSSYGSQAGSQSTPAERDLFKMASRKFTDRLNRATARDNGTGNTNKTRTLDRTNEKTYSRYDTEGAEKSNIRKNFEKDRAEFRKEHPVGRWLGAEGNNALWGLDAELAKGVDFFLPDVITPKKVQQGLDYYKKQGEEAQKTVEKERGGSVERTILGTVGGESLKNIPSATMAYLSGGASVGAQVAGKAVPSLYKASELTHVGNTFTRALNEVARTTGKNPMFWETFARTIGTTYEKELQNGADPIRATMSAYTNALLNAQIEVGGGIEVYDPSETFLKAIARSAKEEGLEEVEQYAVENLVNKAMGSNTAKWFSLTRGQDAVVNPVDMAEQGFYGAITGGLLSGGRTALANARTEAIDSALNPVSAEAVQQGMADQRGLVNRGLVQERADEDGEQISTKAKSIAQELQAQLDKGEELQPNQVKRLIREINKESRTNEQSLERARVREVGKSLNEGSFVEETGLNLEQQISKQKDSALESRSKEKVKAILGENASDNEVASVTKVVIGTANSSDIDTVLTKPSLKNAVADMVNEGADADSKIQIPINNAEARTVLENLTAMKSIANRNAILKETQDENSEDIKALLTNLNSGGKDLFANNLARGTEAIGDVYQNRFYRMYNEGRKDGADFEEAYDRLIAPLGSDVQAVFTRDFAQQIFAQGKASLATDNAKATAKSLAEKYANRASGVTYENNDDSIISEAEKKGLETLAEAGNVEIRVMKNLTATDKDGKALLTKDGKELMVNGMYKDGTIYISANTKNKLITVAKHELTHYIKEMSPERYKELEDFVLKKWYKNDPVAMAKRIEEYQRLYKDATPEEAREEIIADASEAFFTDEATIQEAVSFSKKLGKAIHDGIKHILDAFTGDTRGYRGYGDFMKDLGILQEAERMWLEALEDTQQRKRNARGNATAEDYVDASTQYTTSDEKHSIVENDDEIERLNSEPTQKSYRAMALIDGKLYPPMATRVKDENGKWVLQQGADIGQWLKSDITTDHRMFNSKGQFLLKKDNGGSPLEVAYNPYIHSSDVMLNDQFASAHKRPNIVVVEGEIPRSELENGKRAEHDLDDGRHIKAKDPTGTVQWKAGVVQSHLTGTRTVYLTNHFKPTRIVPDSEVARSIQKMVAGTDVVIPYNVVTPSLRQELLKLGVKMEQSKQKGYQVDLNAKYSVTPEEDQAYMDAVNRGDMETAQKMVDEQAKKNGYDIKAYHGTNAQFTRFDPDKLGSKNFMAGSAYLGFFASASKETAESYTGLNSMDAMATVFSSQSKDYMEKIKSKYNYDERQAELDNQREQFFENYRRENRYYEEVEDPIKELKQQFEQNRQIFVRKDGSDYFDNFMKDFEDNHRTSLIYDWNKKHLNDMYRAWEETQAYKNNQELEQKIYKEWEKYEIKRRGYVPHVLDLYLKMERPFVHDFKGEGRDTESFASRMAQAKEEGYDGCIFKNVADGADIDDIYTVFSNTQLKSADPVTYDDDGNVIPLSERFNEENEDIRWSVSADDQDYMDAVNKGDMETAQRMVDEEAKIRGYALKAYHGTKSEPFNVFDRSRVSHGRMYGDGFYFSPYEDIAGLYGTDIREYYIKTGAVTGDDLDNETLAITEYKDIADKKEALDFYRSKVEQFKKYGQGIERFRPSSKTINGKHRITYTTVGVFDKGNILVVTEPQYIKSADPVTYDDKGNVIPLSQRFNENNEDIRWSVSEDSDGNKLSEGQREYFKDSKVRDENGNLLKVYHGTGEEFYEFSRDQIGRHGSFEGAGFNFTPSEARATGYAYSTKEGKVLGGYLNITNPLSNDKVTFTANQLAKIIRDIDPTGDDIIANYAQETRDYGKPSFIERESLYTARQMLKFHDSDVDIYSDLSASGSNPDAIISAFQSMGYDGLIHYNPVWGNGKFGGDIKTLIAFDSNQFKLADNLNPTEDADIRYSVTTENEPLPKGGKIPKSMEKWAKKVGLETLSKQDSKVPVNVSVRSLRSYWYAMNGRTDEARTVNNSLRSVADALQKLSVKYKYIGLDDAMNATVHYRTDEKGRPTSVYLTCQVKNAEYEINYDFTTICAKRAPLQKVLERFIKTEGERMDTLYDELKLDEEGMYKLRLILEQAGFEVSCIACFVEQNRYSQQAQAETVATDWNKALDEWARENGTRVSEHFNLASLDLKSIPFEEIKKGFTTYYRLMREWKTAHPKESANVAVKNRMLIEAIPYFRKRMNPSEYASIDGQRALMAMGNKKTNLYNLLKRGQGYAKQSVPFVAYNGEVALLPDRVKNKSLFNYLMSIGGARAQSASDFQIEYVFDYMQMVADLSARRLPMHMYTKVIELAELFGKTGIKINLSAMCAVDNSVDSEYAGLKKVNGRWVYNISDQSIDYNKAVKLQRQEGYSKNIGIIMVTLSKYHMLKALGDKDVRYIIGYHSSKMPAVVSKASDMESAMDCTKINKTNRLNDKGRELFDRAMSIAKGDTELERYKNALRIFDDMIQKEVSKEKADKRPRRGNEYSRYMTGFKANTADFDVYNDIKSTKDPRKTADNYIQYCMDNDLIPMYFPFAFHENYYKCEVYDFNMFDNNTGEYAPMEAVQNIYPDLDMTKGETDTTKFMGRVSKYMNEQNKKNKALEPKYQEVERRAKETLRIDIDGNDHMDMDAMEIDPNEYKHRADVLTDIRDGKASVSEVEDSEYGRLQKENETLKEAVWERNEQISVERMRAEMDVQRERRRGTERKRKAVNETRERYEARINDLKEQQKERERKAKERREEAERRDKEHRKQVHERASARRRASEERARQERQEQREARRERKQDSEARTRLLNIARRLDRIKGTDEFNRIRDQLIGNLDLEAKSMTGKTKMKLEDLEKWYQDQVENNDWFVKNERLEKKFERLRKTHISDMSLEDVQNLTEILLMLEHKVRNDKKLINSQYKKDVFMASFETAEGIKQSKGLKFKGLHKVDNIFIGQVLSPIRYMRRLTGYDEDNPLMIATRELQKGEIASLDYRRRALEPFLKFTDMKFTSYLNGNKAPEIEVNATTIDMKPTTVKITPAIRIWFYLSSMNADNMRHIVNGGVRIPDVKLLKKGKRTDAYDNGTLVRFSKSQVQAIIDGMTSKEEAYAKAVFNYFNKVAPEATNAVSETLDGISIAKVKNYVPIHVDDTFLDVEGDTIKMDGTVEGMGSHKERVQSSKPAYAEDVSDLLMRSIDADMKYVGMAIPLRNFGKIYRSSSMESARGQAEHIELTGETNNSPSTLVYGDEQTATYRTRTGGYVSVRDAIRSLWTSDATKYIDKFLSDLQFPRSQVGEVERTLRELTSNYAGAVLTLNASVAIKQSASYPTAGAVLGWKPLIKAFTKVGKLDLDYANSVTPLLAYRAEGFNFREAGDIQNRDGRDSWFKRIMRTPLFNWIQGMDLLTTRKLFKASEIYVQDKYHLKRGQSGYDEKVAEIFNKVITETQPNYTVMERAGHLRSDSTLERTLSMFKTQPYQNFNIWYDATGDYLDKRDAYKKAKTKANREALKEASVNLGNATTSQIAQLAVFAVMTSLWALARGKDDKWRDEEGNLSFASYLKQLAHDMIGGVASEFFLGSDVFSALDSVINDSYYSGFSSVTDSSINDFFNTGMDMTKLLQQAWDYAVKGNEEEIDTDKLLKQMEKVVTEGGRFSGIPTGNLINLKNLMYRWVCVSKDGEYIGEYEAMKMSFAKDTYKKELLKRAYRNDKKAYEELRQMMIDDGMKESTLDKYINDSARENPTEEQTNSYKRSLTFLEGNRLWYNNDSVYIEDYDNALRDIALGIDTDDTDRLKKLESVGISPEENVLIRLAMEKADILYGDKNGSLNKDEKLRALDMVRSSLTLTEKEKEEILKTSFSFGKGKKKS